MKNHLEKGTTFEAFSEAAKLNPKASLATGAFRPTLGTEPGPFVCRTLPTPYSS